MSFDDDFDTLRLGEDYILDRWTYDDIDEETGHIVWHYPGELPEHAPEGSIPHSEPDWDRVTMVTVDYEPGEGHDYRNLAVNPDRPLDPPGAETSPYGPEPYDIDDLATGWKIISP